MNTEINPKLRLAIQLDQTAEGLALVNSGALSFPELAYAIEKGGDVYRHHIERFLGDYDRLKAITAEGLLQALRLFPDSQSFTNFALIPARTKKQLSRQQVLEIIELTAGNESRTFLVKQMYDEGLIAADDVANVLRREAELQESHISGLIERLAETENPAFLPLLLTAILKEYDTSYTFQDMAAAKILSHYRLTWHQMAKLVGALVSPDSSLDLVLPTIDTLSLSDKVEALRIGGKRLARHVQIPTDSASLATFSELCEAKLPPEIWSILKDRFRQAAKVAA